MSGLCKRVQAIICNKNPQVLFISCTVHTLNWCVVHAVESTEEVKTYLRKVRKLYNWRKRFVRLFTGGCVASVYEIPDEVQELQHFSQFSQLILKWEMLFRMLKMSWMFWLKHTLTLTALSNWCNHLSDTCHTVV